MKARRDIPWPADAAPARPAGPFVVGVDPGASGGLAALSLDGRVVAVAAMPTVKVKGGNDLDARAVWRWLEDLGGVRLVALERVNADRKWAASLSFKFGGFAGGVRAVIEAMVMPLELVPPGRWQGAIIPTAEAGKSKVEALAYCRRRWPDAGLTATARASKPHDGIVDALCIAEWARRRVVGDGQREANP